MRFVFFVIVLLGAGISPARATAEPISYSEQISGDLPAGHPPLPELHLGLGLNTVSGQVSGVAGGRVDFDSFAIVVPLDSQLVAVQYAFTSALFGGNTDAAATFVLRRGNAFGEDIASFRAVGLRGIVDAYSAVMPLIAGTYQFGNLGAAHASVGRFTQDYVWTLDVQPADSAPVPEPTTLLLIATGAAAIYRRLAHRDRQRASFPS